MKNSRRENLQFPKELFVAKITEGRHNPISKYPFSTKLEYPFNRFDDKTYVRVPQRK